MKALEPKYPLPGHVGKSMIYEDCLSCPCMIQAKGVTQATRAAFLLKSA